MSYFHEEQRFWVAWVWLILVTLDVPFIIIAVLTQEWVLLVGVVIISLVATLFAVARLVVDVSVEEITVSFHFLWPTRHIRIADVRRASATTYRSLLEYGDTACGSAPRMGVQHRR